MKIKTFIILIAVLALCAAATALFLTFHQPKRAAVDQGDKLFPALDVNRVASIHVTTPAGAFSLVRGARGWTVPERFNYAADFDKIAGFLRKFLDLKVGETHPASPENIPRLQLAYPGKDDLPMEVRGTFFELKDEKGMILAQVLAGKDKPSKGTPYPYPIGQYLLKDGMIYLVAPFFETLDQKPTEWLKTSLVSLPPADIRTIACRRQENGQTKDVFILTRPEKDKDFEPQVLLAGGDLKPSEVRRLAEALYPLTMEDVAKKPEGTQPPAATWLEFNLYDETVCKIFKEENPAGGCNVRVEVDYRGAEQPKNPANMVAAKLEKDPLTKAKELNQKLAPWVFSISKWKCDALVTDPAKLTDQASESAK